MGIPAKLGIGFVTLSAAGWLFVQNRWLTTDRYTVYIPQLPPPFEGKRILHLSDLHRKRYGEGFNNLINSCKFLEPDYIFFTGDVFSRSETNLEPKMVLMRRLMKLAPVYYILGNHEGDASDRALVLCEALRREGVHVLVNQSERIEADGEYVNIYGTALPQSHYRCAEGFSKCTPITKELMDELLGRPEQGAVNILLSHDPLPFEAYAKWGASLTFSGHVHGGVVRLPLVGGVLSPERKFFPKYSKGLYRLDGSQLVVSTGLGKFRVNNPSQIVLVTLSRG